MGVISRVNSNARPAVHGRMWRGGGVVRVPLPGAAAARVGVPGVGSARACRVVSFSCSGVDAYFNSKRKHTYNSRLSPPLIEARKCPTFGIAITAAVLLAV